MSDMAKFNIPQIGMTRAILNRHGVNDVKEIAAQYLIQQQNLSLSDEWAHDRYLQGGSAAVGTVCSDDSQVRKLCSIWSINHYLGLNRHPYVIEKTRLAVKEYGTGCGTSAMSGGHSDVHKILQARLASFLGKDDAIIFPTGFTSNSGAISILCRDHDTLILIDRDCHASIIDGCKLSGAKYLPFKHNSLDDLEAKLNKYSGKYKNIFVVVESVYSMEGDVAPLKEIVSLKSKYEFLLYVDEAHSFGIYGRKGKGLANQLSLNNEIDFIMTTLSKSVASIGGVVATSKEFCSMLRWSNPYLFQASIPASNVATINACLDLLEDENAGVSELWAKTNYLRRRLMDIGFDIGCGESPIVPVYIRNSVTLKMMERELFNNGVFTLAIQYPIVKASEVRFRFIVNNSHSFSDIDYLLEVLTGLGIKYGIINGG